MSAECLMDLDNHRLKPILCQGHTHPIKVAQIKSCIVVRNNYNATFTKTVSKSGIHLVGNKGLKEWLLSIEMKKNGWRRKNRNSKSETVK